MYVKKRAEEFKNVLIFDILNKLVEEKLHTYMTNRVACSHFENDFVSYKPLAGPNGITWLKNNDEKIVLYNYFFVVCPELLRLCLEFGLKQSHYDLTKDFKGFYAQNIKLSEPTHLVDNSIKTKWQGDQNNKILIIEDDADGIDNGGDKGKFKDSTHDSENHKNSHLLIPAAQNEGLSWWFDRLYSFLWRSKRLF